jgi:uncharacterized membrane protein YhaH (DUF805 family)
MEPSLFPADAASTRAAGLTPDQLTALALGADPERLSLVQLYLGVRGRIPRRTYWLHGVLALLLLDFVLNGLLVVARLDDNAFGKLANLVFLWPVFAVSAKRQHDFDFSAWWVLVHFVPVVGSIALVIVDGILPGTRGANRFGADPREALARARISSVH